MAVLLSLDEDLVVCTLDIRIRMVMGDEPADALNGLRCIFCLLEKRSCYARPQLLLMLAACIPIDPLRFVDARIMHDCGSLDDVARLRIDAFCLGDIACERTDLHERLC